MVAHSSQPVTKLLSTKLFVGIGLISYSLYLWHYPIFSFSRIANFTEGDIFKKILLALIILFLAFITYVYIEKPARNKRLKFKSLMICIFCSLVIVTFSNTLVIKNDGFRLRLPKILSENFYERPETLLKNIQGENCHDNINGCLFNTSSKKKVYIIGDSHMASIMYDLKNKLLIKDYQFITSVFSQCIFFPEFNKVTKRNNQIDINCNDKYFKRLEEKLKYEKDAIIIFGGRWPVYFNKNYFDNKEGGVEDVEWESEFIPTGKYSNIKKSFKENVTKISENNKIIIVYPIPEVGIDVPRALYNKWLKGKFKENYLSEKISTSYLVYKKRNSSSFDFLNSFDNSNIYKVFPHKLFCNKNEDNRCITHDDNHKFYCDNNHPSIKGAEMINNLIINKIELIENE